MIGARCTYKRAQKVARGSESFLEQEATDALARAKTASTATIARAYLFLYRELNRSRARAKQVERTQCRYLYLAMYIYAHRCVRIIMHIYIARAYEHVYDELFARPQMHICVHTDENANILYIQI